MKTSVRFFSPRSQHGAALFVALVFLILLTILGLAAAGSSVLQERMTGGTRNRQLAMMGVESAVRGGEFAVWSAPELANYSAGGDVMAPCTTGASNCVFVADGRTGQLDSVVQTFRSKREWVATFDYGTRIYAPPLNGLTGNKETASLASQPLFIIEDLGNDLSGLGPLAGKYKMGGAILPETGGGKGPPPRRLYRVTARSQGGSAQAAARVAESVYSAYGTNHQYNPDATP